MTESEKSRRIIEAGMTAEASAAGFASRKKKKKKPGPIVEDESVVGGTDEHGAPVIVPKRVDGTVQENVSPTDPREKSSGE